MNKIVDEMEVGKEKLVQIDAAKRERDIEVI